MYTCIDFMNIYTYIYHIYMTFLDIYMYIYIYIYNRADWGYGVKPIRINNEKIFRVDFRRLEQYIVFLKE